MTESAPKPPVRWKRTGSVFVKGGSPTSPLETAIPFGPGHPRTRVRHSHGPAIHWQAGEKRGTTKRGDVLELTDATVFRIMPGSGQATLLIEKAA